MIAEVYLDNNASTRVLRSVSDIVLDAMNESFGNASSPHSRGLAARKSIENARSHVARLIGTLPDMVTFTSGTTEANNTILNSIVEDQHHVLITTMSEHPSLTSLVEAKSPDRLIEIPLASNGLIDLEFLESTLACHLGALVAFQWASGETGVLQPVECICMLAQKYNADVLLDASQAVGRIPITGFAIPYTWLTFSAHKLHGPQGVGALVSGRTTSQPQLLYGGAQEQGRRSGTENIPGIVGFGEACRIRQSNLENDIRHLGSLRDRFECRLKKELDCIRVNGANTPRLPNTSNVTFLGIDGIALVARADASGVIFSQVSACSSARPEPSRTLLAMGLTEDEAFGSVRFSTSTLNTTEEIDRAVSIVVAEARTLRRTVGVAA